MGKVDFPENACIVPGKTDEVFLRLTLHLYCGKGAFHGVGGPHPPPSGAPSPMGKAYGNASILRRFAFDPLSDFPVDGGAYAVEAAIDVDISESEDRQTKAG